MKRFHFGAFQWVVIVALFFHTFSSRIFSQWSTDPAVNSAIITGVNQQSVCRIASDGHGGAIVTWWDYEFSTSDYDIYAQRIDSMGNLCWDPAGVSVCTNPAHQQNPEMASDGEGGAIITWFDQRNGKNEIFAQKINAEGIVQWTADGVSVGTVENHYQHSSPAIVNDGYGGAIIAWEDWRGDLYNAERAMYAQHFNANGEILWGTGGIPLSGKPGERTRITNDGMGGAIVTWHRYIDTTDIKHFDVYAQQVSSGGSTGWGQDGMLVCTYSGDQMRAELTGDGKGGAIIVWEDYRDGHTYSNLCAQRVSHGGLMRWNEDGIVLAPIALGQRWQKITGDGKSGAIVTWQYSNNIIYAQRIDSSGVCRWPSDGAAIGAAGDSRYPDIVSDGNNGAIITWYDFRGSGKGDIFAQRINTEGEILWTVNGASICRNQAGQASPVITTDGNAGAIIAWDDVRNNEISSADIYAQKINRNGTLGNETNPVSTNSIQTFKTSLDQNFPNPFSESTQINFTTGSYGNTSVKIYDIYGREVLTLLDREMVPGTYTLNLDAGPLEEGIYFCRLQNGSSSITRSMVVFK